MTPSARRSLGAWASPIALSAAFVIALVLIIAGALIDLRNDRALADSNRLVATTLEALEKVRQLGNLLYVAESSERGYLITGNDADLAPYRQMRANLEPRLGEVSALVSSIPEQRANVERLRTLAIQQFAQMDRTIAEYREHGQAAAFRTLAEGDPGGGMATVRQVIQSLLNAEGRLLTDRRSAASNAYSHGQAVSFLSNILIALALSAFYLLMQRYLRQRDDVQRELEASNAELERRVSERTADLSQLSRHLLDVREGEKKTIARELHDEFGSYLTAINMDVSRVRDKIAASEPEQAARLERTLGLLEHAIEMKRRLISELRPSILDNLGLGAALEQYIDDWSRYTGISTTFRYSGELDGGDDGCPIAIFRVFQEALNNVAKHSGASEVTMFIVEERGVIRFEIADNGSGLTDEGRAKPGTHGLLGIRERVLAYHGSVEYATPPKGGTVLRATVDCRATARTAREPTAAALA